MFGEIVGRVALDLLVTGEYELMPTAAALSSKVYLLQQFCYAELLTKVGGAVTTTAQFKVGGNANHDNVAPLFTVPAGAQVGVVAMLPLVASPFIPFDMRLGPVIVEVTRAAIGPTELTGELLLIGFQVGR